MVIGIIHLILREMYVDNSQNNGNFIALLNFRIDVGDSALKKHLTSAAWNATYTSNTINNQIISILADQVSNSIIASVKAAKWFSIIADETDVQMFFSLSQRTCCKMTGGYKCT